jgi:hypothetical protein
MGLSTSPKEVSRTTYWAMRWSQFDMQEFLLRLIFFTVVSATDVAQAYELQGLGWGHLLLKNV